MAETVERHSNFDIIIESLQIEKRDNESIIQIIPPAEETGEIFVNLSITEGINKPGINGNLHIKETGAGGDYFNFLGNELIKLRMRSPDIEGSTHDLTFCVSDVTMIGDETEEELDGVAGSATKANMGWRLDFISCESYFLNWGINSSDSYIDGDESDFIGKIATDNSEGLVNTIASRYFDPSASPFSFSKEKMEIEPTHNSIWLKNRQNMYPWGKDTHQPTILELMNNLAENSVTEDQKGINYLFYQDLDGWHFKSVRSMIKDHEETEEEDTRKYYVTDSPVPFSLWNDKGDPRIEQFRILSEYDHLRLWREGAYSTYYELIKPNYSDPYFDYVDFSQKHQKENSNNPGELDIIDYGYHRDIEAWGIGGKIERYKLVPDSIETEIDRSDPENIPNRIRRTYDESGLYGYFSSPYNNQNENELDYMRSIEHKGKFGKMNDVMWQTMFDQTDLEIETLKKIQQNIKKPLRKRYKEYSDIINTKEKWNVYSKSICCDSKTQKNVFLAVIDDAKHIQEDPRGGIFEYSWKEVEMWPKDAIEEIDGEIISNPDAPITVIIPTNGLRGTHRTGETWTNPAFNINELLNIEDGDNVYVGPGVNVADEDFNDYAEAFQMMPVGGYFQTEPQPCEMEDGADVYFHGHIVQMYKLEGKGLDKITTTDPEGDDSIPTEIYFFDVPNAHDGLCSCP
tara:strand:- start:7450 stop:9504 length:2055 start_codon:yes stop_codon:yes gene_type:complete